MEYGVGTKVLNNWEIVRLLGKGATGKVFEIHKTEFGVTTKSALKIVTIPNSMSEVKAALTEGMDEKAVTEYFGGFVRELVKEIAVMSELKGHSNIVNYEDHSVIKHEDEIGWDVLTRMELLKPMSDYLYEHAMTETEVLQLGKDLCSALAYCKKKGLIHRDIKPENIFINEEGKFKLGDFGIARTIEKTSGGLSRKGTESYMAPEVYLGKRYDETVDIYSVGLVLYKLMNKNRLPFFPQAPNPISFGDRENALAIRMSGKEEVPSPIDASEEFAKVILKACQFNVADRYQSAEEMLTELNQVVLGEAKEVRAPLREASAEEEEGTIVMVQEEETEETEIQEKMVKEEQQKETAKEEQVEKPAKMKKVKEKTKKKWIILSVIMTLTLGMLVGGIIVLKKRSCYACGKAVVINGVKSYAGDYWCPKCYKKATTCTHCGATTSEGEGDPGGINDDYEGVCDECEWEYDEFPILYLW